MEENIMKIDLKNILSISEANQNFSKATHMVDNCGPIVIMKNNKPKYVLMSYDDAKDLEHIEEMRNLMKKETI